MLPGVYLLQSEEQFVHFLRLRWLQFSIFPLLLTFLFPANRHPLSDELKSKIESQINFQESKFGFWKQFLFGLLLPSGLLLGNCFDLDRDMPLLRDEISQILSTVFAPQEYKMVEYVTEGKYKDGKILYKIHF